MRNPCVDVSNDYMKQCALYAMQNEYVELAKRIARIEVQMPDGRDYGLLNDMRQYAALLAESVQRISEEVLT